VPTKFRNTTHSDFFLVFFSEADLRSKWFGIKFCFLCSYC